MWSDKRELFEVLLLQMDPAKLSVQNFDFCLSAFFGIKYSVYFEGYTVAILF